MQRESWRLSKLRQNGRDFLSGARVRGLDTGLSIGASVVPISLDQSSAGSVVISGFGRQVSKVVLAATIVDRGAVQVPFHYSAVVGAGTLAAK